MNEEKKPKVDVGIGVMIFKDGKILLGKRMGSHGAGDYAFTGGHLEYMESFEECARRETMEEAGINIKNIKFLSLGNIDDYAPRHYVGIGLTAEWESGEPKVLEVDKRESWDWYDLDNLPQPLFFPAQLMIDAYKEGKIYYDKK
ncbi:MAG: NUDIX domain-containing protein [Patescibacteria group bacterium]|nr:NUDIX domain-containing protein [Patescibacteria group bacterium]